MILKERILDAYAAFMEWLFPPKFYSVEQMAEEMFPVLTKSRGASLRLSTTRLDWCNST